MLAIMRKLYISQCLSMSVISLGASFILGDVEQMSLAFGSTQ